MGKSLFPIHGKAQSQPNPTMFALQLPGEKLHPCAWPQTVWIWIVESFFWAPQKYQLIWLCTVDTWLNRKATEWILLRTQPVSGLNKKNKTNIPPKKTIKYHHYTLYKSIQCNHLQPEQLFSTNNAQGFLIQQCAHRSPRVWCVWTWTKPESSCGGCNGKYKQIGAVLWIGFKVIDQIWCQWLSIIFKMSRSEIEFWDRNLFCRNKMTSTKLGDGPRVFALLLLQELFYLLKSSIVCEC